MRPFLTVRVAFDSDPLASTQTWTDITRYVKSIATNTGRQQETADFQAGTLTLTLANHDRRFDPYHTTGPYFGKLLPKKRINIGAGSHLNLPGVDGAYASAPDTAALDITGDLDLRACIRMNDWTPQDADFGFAAIIGKWLTAGAYGLFVTSTGFLSMVWVDNGGVSQTATSTVATGFTNATDHWIRGTLDVDNGAAGRDIRFYTSDDPIATNADAVTWTPLGATVTQAGVTTIRATTDTAFVGAISTSEEWVGRFYRGEIRNGINGTVVASPDFTSRSTGPFVDTQGNQWQTEGAAALAANPVVYPIYSGFVDGWPQTNFRPPGDATTTITATDWFGLLSNIELALSPYFIEVEADAPELWFPFGEQVGTKAYDLMKTAEATYRMDPATAQGPSLVVGHPGGSYQEPRHTAVIAPSLIHLGDGAFYANPMTLECWAFTNGDTGTSTSVTTGLMLMSKAGAGVCYMTVFGGSALGFDQGELKVQAVIANSGGTTRTITTVDPHYFADRPRHVVAVCNTAGGAIYIDGQAVSITGSTGSTGAVVDEGYAFNTLNFNADNQIITLAIDEAAFYDYALSSARITAHYNAGAFPWISDSTGGGGNGRTNRILNLIGIPGNVRNIDTGLTRLGSSDLAIDALTYLKSLEATEDGQFYADAAGVLQFRDRNQLAVDLRRNVVQAAFSDLPDFTAATWDTSTWDTNALWGSPPTLRYEPDGLTFELSDQYVYNDVSVSWDEGTETWSDAASIATYGRQSLSVSTRLATAGEAKLRAIELVDRYKDARTQISTITVDLAGTKNTAEHFTALGLRIGDRVQVRFHPQSVGSALEIEAHIEGISDQIDNGINQWERSFNLSLAV